MRSRAEIAATSVLKQTLPRPGFFEALLQKLRESAAAPLASGPVGEDAPRRPAWLAAGAIAGALGAAGVTFGTLWLRRGDR